MPTRESVLTLARSGLTYQQIGAQLGITPGLAYLVATGLPADGGDAPGPEAEQRAGVLPGSTQYLANPTATVPKTDETVGAWIHERAAQDAALRAAWAARPVTPPPLAEDGDDLIDVIGHDHGQARYVQKQLQTLPGASAGGLPDDLRRRAEALGLLRALLAAHEEAEAQVFWPLVRERLPDGESFARQGQAQEDEAEELFARLEATPAAERSTSGYDDLVTELVSALRKHLAFEDSVLARVYDETSEQERTELGRRFKAAREASGNPSREPSENEQEAAQS